MAVVRHIAQSDILADTSSHSEGGVIFFDFLGLFLIHYPEWVGMLLNLVVAGYALFKSWDKAKNSYR